MHPLVAHRIDGGELQPAFFFLRTDTMLRAHHRNDDHLGIEGQDLLGFHGPGTLLAGNVHPATQLDKVVGERGLDRGKERTGPDLKKDLALGQGTHGLLHRFHLGHSLGNNSLGAVLKTEHGTQSTEMGANIGKGGGLAKGFHPQAKLTQLRHLLARGEIAGQDQVGLEADDLLDAQLLHRADLLLEAGRLRPLAVDGVAHQPLTGAEQKKILCQQRTQGNYTGRTRL